MKLRVTRDYHAEKSTVNFLRDGAKHYHALENFSFIEKEALKEAIEKDKWCVEGELRDEDSTEPAPYSFVIRYYPEGSVRIGCVVFTKKQFSSLKKWAGVKEGKRETKKV